MKKFILFFLIFSVNIYAYTYNEMLVKAQASIFPKILLLDKKLNQKLINNKIVLLIAHDSSDKEEAINIQNIFISEYKKHLSKYKLKVKTIEFSEVTSYTQATAIYTLYSDTQIINKVAYIAFSKGIISFAYDINNLKQGILLSLALEKNTVIYLNKKNLNNNGINFINSFYEIVKFIN